MLSLAAVPLLRDCHRRPILLPSPRSYSGNKQTAKTPRAFTEVREGIVFVEELLQPAELRKLVNYVHRSEKRFKSSTIISKDGELRVAREARRSRVLTSVAGIRPMLQEKITALLPALKRELSIGSASPERIEMQITASNDGDLFRMHNDNGMLPQRRLSYVYFFFEEPRRFLGGQLCFYDEQNRRILTIRPKNNTIVFFRSERMHEVLRVRVPSREFAHSRFTANGWVRR
jgi:Rps23 Pro-64 3,4-dihydroxylase Tpa1-like proline 4-hydroxylase